jgi:hypothetical protein
MYDERTRDWPAAPLPKKDNLTFLRMPVATTRDLFRAEPGSHNVAPRMHTTQDLQRAQTASDSPKERILAARKLLEGLGPGLNEGLQQPYGPSPLPLDSGSRVCFDDRSSDTTMRFDCFHCPFCYPEECCLY